MAPGECVRIMTGAPLPSRADAVVPVELTEESGGIVRIVEEPGGKTHVRAAGEDFSAGAEVLGPTLIREDPDPEAMSLLRCPLEEGRELVRAVKHAAAIRSARKEGGRLFLQVDPMTLT